jgi:hypothetical protein
MASRVLALALALAVVGTLAAILWAAQYPEWDF